MVQQPRNKQAIGIAANVLGARRRRALQIRPRNPRRRLHPLGHLHKGGGARQQFIRIHNDRQIAQLQPEQQRNQQCPQKHQAAMRHNKIGKAFHYPAPTR